MKEYFLSFFLFVLELFFKVECLFVPQELLFSKEIKVVETDEFKVFACLVM